MKKLFFTMVLSLLLSSVVFSQELKVTTFGVSPRDVVKDSVENYFDRAYNGLLNVGIETKMFFKGEFIDSTLTNPTWTLIEKPAGSVADFGLIKNVDASTQIISLIPDVVGTYRIVFSDGLAADTISFNAALYLGVTNGTPNCKDCHNTAEWDFKYDEWMGTGHSSMLERGLNGTLSDHYASYCISCHTVGYDPNANNDGFDDFSFVFPDTLIPGMYDSMMVAYPDAMERANIQCESCHGPGSGHFGNKYNIAKTLSTDNCAWCHDSGTHHIFPEQWDNSVHGNPQHPYTRASCAPCHNGAGFVEYVENGKVDLTEDLPENVAITCATCHDPHDATNLHQLRTLEGTLGNGVELTQGGTGVLCMNCHKSRRNGIEYTNDYLNHLSTHYGPHHGPQADMLYATNVPTWGENLPTSPHLSATEDACVTCHMSEEHLDMGTEVPYAGGHTFSMTYPDGTDNVEACAPCHGNIGTSFSDKKYYVNGSADLDGDGVENGLQIEIQGLLDKLALLCPPVGNPEVAVVDSSVTLLQAQASYNYFFVEEDRSLGIHNPAFTYALLVASIEALGGTVDVGDPNGLPVSYSLSQNYPNPFNPSTTIEYTLPEQSHVTITIYDALGKQLDVLVNGENEAGVHQATWNASQYASGIYFYKMNTEKFVRVKKMLLLK